MNEHFEWGRNKCECGNDTFQVVFLGTPCTPPDLMGVMTKCSNCGLKKEWSVKDVTLLRTEP